MWVRSAAIRPVAPYAKLPAEAFVEVEAWLGEDEEQTEDRLGRLFDRFEREQPLLAERIGLALARTRDEVALALGYFLSLSLWLAFANSHGTRLRQVDELALRSVEEALELDEELRGADPHEVIDSDDVIAMEQPHALTFIHEHLEAALEVHAGEVDVDAVNDTYRLVLVELLALSYAVTDSGDHGDFDADHEACA